MELLAYKKEVKNGKARLVGKCQRIGHNDPFELWYEYPEEYEAFINESPDPFIPPLLIASLLYGETLKVPFPISTNLYENLGLIQDIFCNWFPNEARQVQLELPETTISEPRNHQKGVLAFFSGGVDSFYTLLKTVRKVPSSSPNITHLAYMKGVETPLTDFSGIESTAAMVREVAQEAQLPIIIGSTNIRDHFKFNWAYHLCGAGLASVGLSLGRGISNVLIPSTFSYDHADMYPEGSHPVLDGLWSTEYTRVWHSGGEAHRVDKLAWLVGRDPLALSYLRVCTENKGGLGNCGRCQKCVYAMIPLQAMGVLKDAKTFPDQLDYDLIKILFIEDVFDMRMLTKSLALAIAEGRDPVLIKKLKTFIRKHQIIEALRLIFGPSGYELIMKPWRFLRTLKQRKGVNK